MITGIFILAFITLFTVFTHRRSRFEEKIIKHVPLAEWITVLLLPVWVYIGWAIVVKNIIERETVLIFPFDDFEILAVSVFSMLYGFVGMSLHFSSKVLWRYLKNRQASMAYRVNEMFHGRLSHYVIYLNTLIVATLLPILEINHPVQGGDVTPSYLFLSSLGGVLFGIAGMKTVFYTHDWFGGYTKPMFANVSLFLFLLLFIFRFYNLNPAYYPVSVFILTAFIIMFGSFVFRIIFRLSRLHRRKRLQLIARMLRV